MRLSTEEKHIIKSTVKEVMGESASVFLFGSRVDESKRGGDIDLFIDANLPNALDRVQKKSRLWAILQQRLGEQRIDIIIAANKPEERQEIEHVARKTGIRII